MDENSRPLSFLARFKKRLSRENYQQARSDEKFASPAPVVLAATQRVDMAVKITTSIKYAAMSTIS
jgi:hypothetical protein